MSAEIFQRTRAVAAGDRPLQFRPIRSGDEADLLAFFRDRLSPRSQYFFCPHDPSQPEKCLQQFAERIRRHGEQQDLAFVVEDEGVIVGYFYISPLDPPEGRLPVLGIGLADALHGRRLGGAMMDHLLSAAHDLGLPVVELTHESTNERAGRLYTSRGFAYTGEDRVQESGRIERVMVWQRQVWEVGVP